ncbi:CoA-binding protein, partial [Paraburkholderia aspalathi]|nr:CoA-binding protein [Paraburkholderia aspalathi]
MLKVNSCMEEGHIRPALRKNFARLLAPRSIAFIGGSQVEATLKTLKQQDFSGDVYVVNPKRSEIAGYKCIPSVADLPVSPDAVFLAVNADVTIIALRELSAMQAGGVVCY